MNVRYALYALGFVALAGVAVIIMGDPVNLAADQFFRSAGYLTKKSGLIG
jgi:Na+/H+ antiporter NhaD/arsenite permease-like protein